MSVTAAVMARDEERQIVGCLRSLAWADELLLLDNGSVDRTRELAQSLGARVEQRPWASYARNRQWMLDLAEGDWLLMVDADERVSPHLAAEVRDAIRGAEAAFWVPRRNYIWGRWVHGGGWWPDEQLRLLRRDRASYAASPPVHELAAVNGTIGRLRCALVHYNYDTVGEFFEKQRRYAAMDARGRLAAGERTRPRRLLGAPARELWRRYVELDGRRDGWHGARLAALTALGAAEAELRLLQRLA